LGSETGKRNRKQRKGRLFGKIYQENEKQSFYSKSNSSTKYLRRTPQEFLVIINLTPGSPEASGLEVPLENPETYVLGFFWF